MQAAGGNRLPCRFCAVNYKLHGLLHLFSKLLELSLYSSNVVRICAAARTHCITSGANTRALSLVISQPDMYMCPCVGVYNCSVFAFCLLFIAIYFEFIFAKFNFIWSIYKHFLFNANVPVNFINVCRVYISGIFVYFICVHLLYYIYI